MRDRRSFDWDSFAFAMKMFGLFIFFAALVGSIVYGINSEQSHARAKFAVSCKALHGTMYEDDDAYHCVVNNTMISSNK